MPDITILFFYESDDYVNDRIYAANVSNYYIS
jgi:hypothetical protein